MESYDGKRGMILGKFMPPHRGHKYLIDFARGYVKDLTVLVCSLEREPIPGKLRYRWMRESFPEVDMVHVTDEVPQEPSEHPDFWGIWKRLVEKEADRVDYVFASEEYGGKLAEVLGAEFVPVDLERRLVPVSGTMVREDPMKNWEYILPAARAHFAKRVCVFGPESTGKSTLARDLANHFKTAYVSEYARGLLDPKGGRCDYSDIPRIVRGQIASEEAMAKQANRVLFCDTDVLTTTVWSDALFGRCPKWIKRLASQRDYELYLLLDIDVPWVDDEQRFYHDRREWFMEKCVKALEDNGRRYVRISGDWGARLRASVREVEKLLGEKP